MTAIKTLVVAMLLTCAGFGAAAAPSTPLRFAVNGGDSIARYSEALVTLIAKNLKLELVPSAVNKADIIANTLMYPKADNKLRYIKQEIATVPVRLCAKHSSAALLDVGAPYHWPRMTVAIAPGIMDATEDFVKWRHREFALCEENHYIDAAAALESVINGNCQLMLTTTYDVPENLVELTRISEYPCFIAVGVARRKLAVAIENELRRLLVEEPDVIEKMRKQFNLTGESVGRKVRVGRYFEPGLCWRENDGTTHGANEDYISAVAEMSGWDVEWIYGDYTTSLEDLAKGRLDVMAGVTFTEERARNITFPHMPTGLYRAHLFCRRGADFTSNQYAGWSGAVIATGPGVQANSALVKFLSENGIDCRIHEYESADEAVLGYYRGECNMLHTVGTPQLANEKILLSFPAVPAFVCTTPIHPELARDVESALAKIESETPEFHRSIAERYYMSRFAKRTNLDENEEEYLIRRKSLGEAGAIKVELSPLIPPLKDIDFKFGTAGGFIKSVFDEISRRTGLRFQYLTATDETIARRRFLNGESELWASYGANLMGLPIRHDPIRNIRIPRSMICRRDVKLNDPTTGVVAAPEWERMALGSAIHGGSVGYVHAYPSIKECLEAVRQGKADCAICPMLIAASLLREVDPDNSMELRAIDNHNRNIDLPLVAGPETSALLVSILRKTIAGFNDDDIEAFEAKTLVDSIGGGKPFMNYSLLLVLLFLSAAFIVFAIFLAIFSSFRIKSMRKQQIRLDRRDNYFIREAEKLKGPLNIIEARAEYLRNPDVSRDMSLIWTAEIIHSAETILQRFSSYVHSAEVMTERDIVVDLVSDGGECQ